MKHPCHFESPRTASGEGAKVRALIGELDRRVRVLETEITKEEQRTGVSDPCRGAYPVMARMLLARRDNLKETIAALERRLTPDPAASA